MLSQSEKLEQFFFYTILKDFLCIHIFQRYSFQKSLRSAPSAFPSLIGKSSSFPSSSSFHKSPASMQKLCRTQHAMIVWLVKAILLSSCFWRTLQCPFSISNAHSTATLALESSLLKSISSGSLIASLYGFLATTWREDRHCRPTNWASLPYCQLLQLVLVVIHYCLFADVTRRFSESWMWIMHTAQKASCNVQATFFFISYSLDHNIMLMQSTK